jgi:DNA-binding transcriptional LysR family regulator
MCRPGYVEVARTLSLSELMKYTIIDQAHASGLGDIIRRWLSERRIEITNSLPSSSLSAIAALTVAGHGVSYLPRHMFEPMIATGRLCVIDTKPRLMSYSANEFAMTTSTQLSCRSLARRPISRLSASSSD